MVIRMLRRSFTVENPVGWIALGVASLLAVPAIRRTLRSATVNAAVGVMALGDGVKRLGGGNNDGTVQTDAGLPNSAANSLQTHDQSETRTDQSETRTDQERPWLRQAVVNGLASTMNATEGVVKGTRGWMRKVRTAGSTEIGRIGADTASSGGSLLPAHLLPQTAGAQTRKHYSKHGAPDDFAVKNSQALRHFVDDVAHVGADFKPDYHSLVDLLKRDSD